MPSLCGHNEFVSVLDSCDNSNGEWEYSLEGMGSHLILFPKTSVEEHYIAIITIISIVTAVQVTKIIKGRPRKDGLSLLCN